MLVHVSQIKVLDLTISHEKSEKITIDVAKRQKLKHDIIDTRSWNILQGNGKWDISNNMTNVCKGIW